MTLTLLVLLAGCRKAETPKAQPPAVPVTVVAVAKKAIPVQIKAIGNVQAYATVGIKSQVEGVLQKVHFTEGQDVAREDLLFTIDPRPFEKALEQAEAALARDTAQRDNARAEVDRYSQLLARGIVSREDFEGYRTAAAALDGTVRADQALVEQARLSLSHCYIRAPIAGRAGGLLVNQGNLVKANADTPLVVINQVQPVYVAFSVPEENLPRIRERMAAGTLAVEAVAPGEEAAPEKGTLTFVDNAVDEATGTIRLKAGFPNADRHLWPGQFVNTVVTMVVQPDALVVPTRAIESGQGGDYVFVVKPDGTVESRPVTVDRIINEETVVSRGLSEGETVVTLGQLRLVPGARVEVGGQAAAPAATKPAAPGSPVSSK